MTGIWLVCWADVVGGAEVYVGSGARVWAGVWAEQTEHRAYLAQLFVCSNLFGADLTWIPGCARYLHGIPKWLP